MGTTAQCLQTKEEFVHLGFCFMASSHTINIAADHGFLKVKPENYQETQCFAVICCN